MLLTNPNGQIEQFKLIQSITEQVLNFCGNQGTKNALNLENTYFVIDDIFNNLRLFHQEQDLIQGHMNLCYIINTFDPARFEKCISAIYSTIQEKAQYHVN